MIVIKFDRLNDLEALNVLKSNTGVPAAEPARASHRRCHPGYQNTGVPAAEPARASRRLSRTGF